MNGLHGTVTLSFDNMKSPSMQGSILRRFISAFCYPDLVLARGKLVRLYVKMPNLKAHQPRFASPADFLKFLGLQDWETQDEGEWAIWYERAQREMTAAGFDLAAISATAETPMDVDMMDALFVNESVGTGFLNTNFNRLVRSMQNLAASLALQSGTALTIAELGGGAGLLAMWLLLCEGGENRRCHVYDYSRNHVKVGEAWARRAGLHDRCFFHCTSYAEVSENNEDENAGDCDFVYADRAMSFHCHEGQRLGANGSSEVGPMVQAQFERRYRELAGSVRRLLRPDGIALLATGPARPLALETFCGQLRESGFFIDWDLYEFNEGPNLYVRYGNTHLLPTPEDEALAIHSSKLEIRENLDWLEAEPLRRLFSKGQSIMTVRYRYLDYPEYEWESVMFQAYGLFLLVQRSSQSEYRSCTGSAAKLLGYARGVLELAHDQDEYEVISEEIADSAKAFLRYSSEERRRVERLWADQSML